MDEERLLKTGELGVPGKLLRYWVRHGLCTPTLRLPNNSWRWDAKAAAGVYRVRDAWAVKEAARRELLRDRLAVTTNT